MYDTLYKITADYVTQMFDEQLHPSLSYHNLQHTKNVVAHTQEIAAQYELNDEDVLILHVAAWFHDAGHLMSPAEVHEAKSVELMREFLANKNVTDDFVDKVAGCIMATQLPHNPQTQLQEIICDADTYHFGTKEFKQTNKAVKKEYDSRGYTKLVENWNVNTITLLERHQYFTNYCKNLLADGKQKNIERLKKKQLKAEEAMAKEKKKEKEKGEKDLSKLDKNSPEVLKAKQNSSLLTRGVQTMLRLTSENHMRLSDMADSKANILISVNAIIISVVLSVLMRKLEVEPYLTIPTIIFLASSVATIVLAILATRPKVTEGRFSMDDVRARKTNLMFFGNFYKSTLEEYMDGMNFLMNDKEYLYSSLVKDIYFLAAVLGRKYKLLRLAYTIFMIGIIVSVIAFTIATMLVQNNQVTTVSMPQGTPL